MTTWPQPQQPVQFAPPPAAQQWHSAAYPGPKTDVLALWAIASAAAGAGTIFFGLGSVVALVLGPIAIVRIRRTGDDGMLLAVSAIVLALLTLVLLIVVTFIGISAAMQLVSEVSDVLNV